MAKRAVLSIAALALLLLGVSGCTSLSYYSQSVIGHSRLMLSRQPVSKVIETAEPELRKQLHLAQSLRAFAVLELGLPKSKSYSSYVALDREFPVWTVVAAPMLSLEAKRWCYPVIGCASYRGYFRQADAMRYASELQQKGFETTVGGVPAYSTLGWFSDPILPSMLRYGDTNLAETLFHELAHQQLYVNGDSDFNEAFATVVGEEGARRWLHQSRRSELSNYQAKLTAREQFNLLISRTKNRLGKLYSSEVDSATAKERKEQVFKDMQSEYQHLKMREWQGRAWFDLWFEQPINNARLAAFSTYRANVPELQGLLRQCRNHLPTFYARLKSAEKIDGKVVVPKHCW